MEIMRSNQPNALLFSTSLCLAIALIAWRVRIWWRLRHVPGPRLAGWTVWWQLRGVLRDDYHEELKKAADKYGPLVRIGPNQLVTSDPDVLRRMSAVRSTYIKGAFYRAGRVVAGVDNVVSETNEEKHKELRAKMWAAYSGKENEGFSFEPGLDRQIKAFLSLLNSKYTSTSSNTVPFDLSEKTQFFALDAIGDISFGKPIGYLESDSDLFEYNKINAESLPVMSVISTLPWLIKVVHTWPMRLAFPNQGDQVGFGRLATVASRLVDKRLDPEAHPQQDMLQGHINAGCTREELIQQVLIFIIAGSNSTAHALRMTILSLITNPAAYRTLLKEIDTASSHVSDPISWSQTQSLPYLQAVIREGIRMWPPVGGLGFKKVPAGGDHIGGYFIPEGTEIGQGFYAVGRSTAVWGPDADAFRPERWLRAEDDELRAMEAAVDTHFGGGKYSCLGRPIAMMELHKMVFELLRHFDVALMDPQRPIKVRSGVFMSASNFWIKIDKRAA